MFPDAESAKQAAGELETAGFDGRDVMLLAPEAILKDIGKDAR